MVYLAYLGKEYGLAKIGVVVIGIVATILGCYGYFASPWVKNNVYKICGEIDTLNSNQATTGSPLIEVTCPNLTLEKVFIIVEILFVLLSTLGLIGNLFSKQLSDSVFKIVDVCYNGSAGLLVIISASLFLYSTVTIDNLFKDLGELPCASELIANSGEYQLYKEKVVTGALAILQGLLHFVTAALLAFR